MCIEKLSSTLDIVLGFGNESFQNIDRGLRFDVGEGFMEGGGGKEFETSAPHQTQTGTPSRVRGGIERKSR